MDRHPSRTMSTSGVELNPRSFRVRQHDIDVFYALVGGGKNAAKSTDGSQGADGPAAASESTPEADVPQSPAIAPVRPVRRGPPSTAGVKATVAASGADATQVSAAATAVEATDVEPATAEAASREGRGGTGVGPAAWAAALHDIAPAPRRVSRAKAKPVQRAPVAWSPKVLCKHLVDRVDQLHIDSWVRKMSGDAMRRLSQAQTRLNRTRPKHP